MGYEHYSCLKINVDRRVAFVTIDHPPFNLMDMPLIQDLDRFSKEVQDDQDVRVVVVQSADPDFFVAHVDASFIESWPSELPPKPTELNLKASVDTVHLPTELGLLEEAHYFNQCMTRKEARERLAEALDLGVQRSREDELVSIADKMAEAHAIKG